MNEPHQERTRRDAPLGRGVIRRTSWSLADQVVSSGTNFAVGVIVARSLPIEDFGAFSVAFIIYTVLMSVARAFPMEPLMIRYSTVPAARWRVGAAAAVGTSLLAGVAAGLVLAVIAIAVGGAIGAALLALALTLPGLLLQDAWRLAFFTAARGRDAFLNDLVWAVALVPAFLAAGLAGAGLFSVTFAWGAAATVAGLLGVLQARVVPRPSAAVAWWREHADLAPRFIIEVTIRSGVAQFTMILVGVIAGLAVMGSIRAAQLIMAPVQVLLLGISIVAVPEAARALSVSLSSLIRLATGAAIAIASASLVWGAFALLLPDAIGRLVLADTWDVARVFLPAWIITQVGAGLTLGPGMSLRAFANARLSLRVTLIATIVTFCLPVGAAFVGGMAAAWAIAVASLLSAALWWLAMPIAVREWRASHSRAATADPGASAP